MSISELQTHRLTPSTKLQTIGLKAGLRNSGLVSKCLEFL